MDYNMAIPAGIEVPRAHFDRSKTYSSTFDCDYLYPVYWEEVYPNDTCSLNTLAVGRLPTLLHPLIDRDKMAKLISKWRPKRTKRSSIPASICII